MAEVPRRHPGQAPAPAPARKDARAAAAPAAPAPSPVYEEKKALDAIVNAAVFRAGLRDWARAEADSLAYLEVWPDGRGRGAAVALAGRPGGAAGGRRRRS